MRTHPTTRIYKAIHYNNFITYFSPFILGLTLILNASGCKNKIDPHPNNIQHDLDLLSQKKRKKKKNKYKNPILDQNNTQDCKTASALSQNEQITFHLTDIDLPIGTTKSMTLAVLGDTESAIGYTIKSVYVTKHTTTNYSKNFGIDELTNKSILPSGLTFMIKNPGIESGTYTLKIKVSKQGKGSKITEQIISCMITCSANKQEHNKPFIEQLKDYSNYGGNMGKIIAGNKGESVGKILGSVAATVNWTYHAVGNTLVNKTPNPQEQPEQYPIDNTQQTTPKTPQNDPKSNPHVEKPTTPCPPQELAEIPWTPSIGLMT